MRRRKKSEIYKRAKRFRGLPETPRRTLAFPGARACAEATGDRRRRARRQWGGASRSGGGERGGVGESSFPYGEWASSSYLPLTSCMHQLAVANEQPNWARPI
jgi:hypothetical protein